MTEFYAQPYSIEYAGFYFDSVEKFQTGVEALSKRGCEEVEIQFIDGEPRLCQLSKSISIGQCDIPLWFDELEDLTTEDAIRIIFLIDLGFSIEDALTHYDDVCLHLGTAADYAQELIEETTEIPENLRYYIDYESIARDMKISGEVVEIERELIVTNALEF